MTDSTYSSVPFSAIKTYEEQRYERTLETVDEYLGDQDVGIKPFLRDIKKACQELSEFHKKSLSGYQQVEAMIDIFNSLSEPQETAKLDS